MRLNNQLPNSNIGIYLVIGLLVIGYCSFAQAKEYDGIWFLGFNLRRPIFQDLRVRQAVNHSIDKNYIVTDIMTEEVTPASFIPPGMLGYNPNLKVYKYNPKFAKLLMRRAKYPIMDKRLKNLTLLHTDGIKTVAIANKIKQDLKQIGMKIKLVQVSYKQEEKWIKELSSGRYDFFLMGYKAGIEELFTKEATAVEVDSYNLIEPLFRTDGEANFTGYSNSEVDELLEQVAGLNLALKKERHAKLLKINRLLYKDLPAVVLFYIEKL